jgi:hypothetical protein
VTCTPKHASWLNTEQWFGVLTRRVLRRGDFTSRDDLETKITVFAIGTTRTLARTSGATTPTPSTPATSNATLSPDPCPPPPEAA